MSNSPTVARPKQKVMRWLAAGLWALTAVVVVLTSLPIPVGSVPVSVVFVIAGCLALGALIGLGGLPGLVAASVGTVVAVLATLLLLIQTTASNVLVAVVIGAIYIVLNGLAVWELRTTSA